MAAHEEKSLNGKTPDEELKPKKKTFREKLRYLKDNITVEPALACYVVPGVIGRLATQNLNLDKACRVNLGYDRDVCDALIAKKGDMYKTEELEVQKLIATMEMWRNVILTAIPSILILFLGAWSDRTGKRKICILLPIVGELLMNVSNILNAYYFYEIPVQVTMFLEAFLPAITGSWVTTYMGTFSYISDISSEESRTFRIGVVNLCLTSGGPVGSALSGILLQSIGYYGVFSTCTVLYAFSLTYGYLYIKDIKKPRSKGTDEVTSSGYCGFLRSFFDLNHIKDTFSVTFKKGPNNRRLKLILVFTAIAFIYGPSYGALIMISVFSRRLKWHDAVLGLISNISKMIGGVATGLAQNSRDMYIAVVIEIFNATSFTALRSISSKLVPSEELGKMTAMFNLMEILTSMVFGPFYSWVYMLTLSIYAGIMFFVSTILVIPAVVIFGWFYIDHRRQSNKQNTDAIVESKPSAEDVKEIIPEETAMLQSIEIVDGDITLHIK
ncbi:hypothetical protein EVAR_28643_1 [Eumeta japonica]|uniref:Proton-coupled folate transporter n=1 Tax=Eumeta variegata TaxID=151549 RepID=A0A4C1ZG27_EUMVA|nr:hypothetical protein EVAR_28643_1 [Eumeta japonica]